ncbi:MAG: cysteine desulfurase [Candidatus Pacebacteria bacterium]|nr:cysteine desulfurase [Candidatus Paceibacterota bacterium]
MFFKHISNFLKNRKRVYLDYASSTPVDPKMHRSFSQIPSRILAANPSALHQEGVEARRLLSQYRETVATTLHAHPDEIIFTSGATESDNLALVGSIEAFIATGVSLNQIAVMTSNLEHAAVLEPLTPYIARGLFLMTLPTNDGVVDPKMIVVPESCTAMVVSVMYVNNEIGTVQPIKDIAKRIRRLRKDHPDTTIVFHTDATQAPLYYNLRVDQLGVDLMTLGATKLYTHKGVGMLYKKRNVKLMPIMRGGGQEFGLRPGTESLELIHAFAHALEYANTRYEEEAERVRELQMYFEELIHEHIPEALVTAETLDRSPHISHVVVRGIESELLVIELDARDIAVSAKSACKNEDSGESAIVETLYGPASAPGFGEVKYGAVRFSFGRKTTRNQVEKAVKALKKIVEKYTK